MSDGEYPMMIRYVSGSEEEVSCYCVFVMWKGIGSGEEKCVCEDLNRQRP